MKLFDLYIDYVRQSKINNEKDQPQIFMIK